MIKISLTLGILACLFLYLNGRKNAIHRGKILEKSFDHNGVFSFKIMIDKKTVWIVKVGPEDFDKYVIGDKYEFKIYQTL